MKNTADQKVRVADAFTYVGKMLRLAKGNNFVLCTTVRFFLFCAGLGLQQVHTFALPPAVLVWFSLFDPAVGKARQPLCQTVNHTKDQLSPKHSGAEIWAVAPAGIFFQIQQT